MADSLRFGTSGLRGLASDLIGEPSRRYTRAFLNYLSVHGGLAQGAEVLVGRDLRASSPEIAAAVIGSIGAGGFTPIDCGEAGTPALALAAQNRRAPAIMVTGSHIPGNRNGLKFYLATGEITKADEAGITESLQGVGESGAHNGSARAWPGAKRDYIERYLGVFPPDTLSQRRIGVFQHSSVMRDDLVGIFTALGADVVPLGRSAEFVPIDTEALGAAEIAQARSWVKDLCLDALVSTDGDADRPLVADETGAFIRGDMLGILAARYLGADAVVTPVTSNSSIEGLGVFARVIRTRVGSPFVIAGMAAARDAGAQRVVGFEANGGLLLGSEIVINGARLAALPTRDAMLPMLAVLAAAGAAGLTLSGLAGRLPSRVARSDRLENVAPERTAALLGRLAQPAIAAAYFAEMGELEAVSAIDGMRFAFVSGDIIHYRASGNAPELRCYAEAASAERAEQMLKWGLAAAADAVR